jgi:hypothetical protein
LKRSDFSYSGNISQIPAANWRATQWSPTERGIGSLADKTELALFLRFGASH